MPPSTAAPGHWELCLPGLKALRGSKSRAEALAGASVKLMISIIPPKKKKNKRRALQGNFVSAVIAAELCEESLKAALQLHLYQ